MRKKCKVEGCKRLSDAKGFCNAHYLQVHTHGRITSIGLLHQNKGKACKVGGCNKQAYSKGYCSRHYEQVRKHGEIISVERMLSPRVGVMLHQGYVYIYQPDHPYAIKHGYVKRANLVWEEMTGQVVVPPALLHHKNEIKVDDTYENLELMANTSEHRRYHVTGERRNALCTP